MLLRSLGRGIAVACALLLAPAQAQAEWLEAKSAHFTVIGNMSEGELRNRTERLERFDSLLRHLFSVKETIPVTVYEVEGMGAVQDLYGDKLGIVGGFYNASAQRAYAIVPQKLPVTIDGFTPEIVMQHEYTHHMLLANASVFMPSWAQEGLAEFFDTAQLKNDGSIVVGFKNESRGEAMLGMHRWSVRRLLESDLDPPKGEEAEEKYSRGWALIHYLWMSGKRPDQYTKFIGLVNQGVDPVTAGEKVFGDLGKLDEELDHYVNAHTYKFSTFPASELGNPGSVTVRKLGPDEVAILHFRMATSVGTNEKTAGPLASRARTVAAMYPNSVAVQETMAEILHDAKDYDGADAAADRVLAAQPTNLMAMVYKGRVAMRRALAKKDQAGVEQARNWFRRAAAAHQDSALPFMLYYDSYTAVGQMPPADAVAGLYRAIVLVPQDASLHVRTALSLLREGNVARARAIIAAAAFEAEGKGENSALKLLKEMDKNKDPKALLAKASELKLDRLNDFVDPPKDEDKDKS